MPLYNSDKKKTVPVILVTVYRSEDDNWRIDGSSSSTARRHHTDPLCSVHLRSDRSADLPGNAQAEMRRRVGPVCERKRHRG